jgi:outer membrane protein
MPGPKAWVQDGADRERDMDLSGTESRTDLAFPNARCAQHLKSKKGREMKKQAWWLVILLFMCLNAGPVFPAEAQKVAVVDLQKCITDSIEGKKIYGELKSKKDSMQKVIDEKQNELLKLNEVLEKQSMMLSMDAKEDKAKEFDRKKREFKYLYEDLTEEMRKAEAEARKGVIEDLESVVQDIGKREGYTLLLERRSSGIMYFDGAIDITEKVIKLFDQKKTKGK